MDNSATFRVPDLVLNGNCCRISKTDSYLRTRLLCLQSKNERSPRNRWFFVLDTALLPSHKASADRQPVCNDGIEKSDINRFCDPSWSLDTSLQSCGTWTSSFSQNSDGHSASPVGPRAMAEGTKITASRARDGLLFSLQTWPLWASTHRGKKTKVSLGLIWRNK